MAVLPPWTARKGPVIKLAWEEAMNKHGVDHFFRLVDTAGGSRGRRRGKVRRASRDVVQHFNDDETVERLMLAAIVCIKNRGGRREMAPPRRRGCRWALPWKRP